MTEAQIKHMVERFLGWRLPKPWNPDNGIIYKRPNYAHAPADHDWPSGTNLFDAMQAEAMVRHMLECLPKDAETKRLEAIASAALALSTAMVDTEAECGNYELVDNEWERLTEAFQVVHETI